MKIDQSKSRLKYLSPDVIDRNPENPRINFRQEEMDILLLSIKKHGIQVPIAVYQEGNKFHLIDGERRWRCAKKLNLKGIPALIQDKPSELQNLLLMYNIHSLREQWDYFTIAKSLIRISDLFYKEYNYRPNESELSEATGLTRSAIRRCNYIIDLPLRFQNVIERELEKPKFKQKLTEDFFIEMEKSLKTVIKRIPEFETEHDKIRDALIEKYSDGVIGAITDFRMLSKIATAVENIGLKHAKAKDTLKKVFDSRNNLDIKSAYDSTVGFEYDEKKAQRYLEHLFDFLNEVSEEESYDEIDDEFVDSLKLLQEKITLIIKRVG